MTLLCGRALAAPFLLACDCGVFGSRVRQINLAAPARPNIAAAAFLWLAPVINRRCDQHHRLTPG
jgi:hypothetical protein